MNELPKTLSDIVGHPTEVAPITIGYEIIPIIPEQTKDLN